MLQRSSLVAVVLAGGGPADRLAHAAGVANKALVPYAGRPLGEYVLRALRQSGVVDRVVLVTDEFAADPDLFDAQLPGGARLVDSLALGLGGALAGAAAPDEVLVVTADVPWLTGAAVREFVTQARQLEGRGALPVGIVYPVVTEADSKARFPDQKRTYARLKEGRFTGGNAVLIRRHAVPGLLPLIDRVFRHRKNPFALARLVGPGTLIRFLLGQASIARLEERVEELLGAEARALPTHEAALAADVDDLAQLSGPAMPQPPVLALRREG